MQSISLPGEVEMTPGPIDARVALPACTALEPSLPPGTRPWGNTTIMVQCAAPNPWTIYVRATVKVVADYLVTTRPLKTGTGNCGFRPDQPEKAIVTQLPPGIVTDWNQAIGRTLEELLFPESPLRQDMLRNSDSCNTESDCEACLQRTGVQCERGRQSAYPMTEGQPVKVRSASGTVVSGIAGIVEVTY